MLWQGMPAKADDVPFRQQRREVFRVLPTDENSIVFLGNSITNFSTWAEGFGSDPRVVNRGISGNLSGEVLEHLDLILAGKPAKIFLMIGINDYTAPEVVVPNTRRIIEVVRRESPSTQLYVQSLLPCNRADRHGMVEPINSELQALCESEGITYIDVYSKLVDGNSANPGIAAAYTNDNLHVTAAGYRLWTSDFEQYTGIAPVWAEGSGASVGSFTPFENIMISEFSLLPVNDGDILMIGDYNVQTGEWAELMGSPKVKNRGIGIGWGYSLTLDKLLAAVPHIVKGNPASIFVQCGARDLGGGTSAEQAYTKYISAIEAIASRAPEADIYMQSVIPFTDASINTGHVVPFNEKIKQYADKDADDHIYYVDVYGALAENDVLNEKFRGANTAQSRGINGRGYLRWANTLAPLMGSGINARPELTDAAFDLNEALSAARRTVYNIIIGDGAGNYTEAAVKPLRDAIAAAEAVAAKAGATDGELAEQTALLKAAAVDPAGIVMPKVSADGAELWYKISAPTRGNRYVQNAGAGSGLIGEPASNYRNQQWKFTERTDGSWNIVSRSDGGYIDPASAANNAQLRASAQEPSSGWTLKPCDAYGRFIIVSGGVQLNQTGAGLRYEVYNWGGGANTADDGCQFQISEVTAEPDPDPKPAEVPEALAVAGDITLDGTAPYRLPDATAQPVLDAESVTVAIDFTLANNNSEMALFGSSNSQAAEDFVCITVASANNFGVRYNNGGGKYTTSGSIGTGRHQIVITMQPESPSCNYYLDGTKIRDVAAKVPTPGNVNGTDGLYLGGIVCSDNANKYPMTGTIHSVQFFPGVLDAAQVAAINYDVTIPPLDGISAVAADEGEGAAGIYDLQGRRTGRPSHGIYIIHNGSTARKVIIR